MFPACHALQAHMHTTFTPTINQSELMIPETFFEMLSKLFTIFGELNGLVNAQGAKSLGTFVQNIIEQAPVHHSISIFTIIKNCAIGVFVIGVAASILCCLLLNTNLAVSCCAAYQRVKLRLTRSQNPPDYEEPAPRIEATRTEVPSLFYRLETDSVEFRDVELRSALPQRGSAPPERLAPVSSRIYRRVSNWTKAGTDTRDRAM